MPDLPPAKRHVELPDAAQLALAAEIAHTPFAELHCKTNYSFLMAASHPDELVIRAAELGYRALAITDRHSLAGVVRAHAAARQVGLKLLIGAEIVPTDASPVVLLATDRASYGRLSRLLTLGRRRAPKGECHLAFDDLATHAEGLLACILSIDDDLARYRQAFGDRCYALASLHRGAADPRDLEKLVVAARRAAVPLAASNDVHYHVPQRQPLQDVLVSIAAGCTVAEAGERLFANAERHLKSPEEMATLFARHPELIARTVEIADRATFSLDELRYEYPEELSPPGQTPLEYLCELTWQGADKRYPDGVPERVQSLIRKELTIIEKLRYEAFFLTVWDLVKFARARGILCQGRGSAANSVVCYALGVTAISPEQIDVLFERFMSLERNEAPDIDVDFEHERREEVIQYVYQKYGRDRAGMTAEVITYRGRSAVRDVGKALGLSLDEVDILAKMIDMYGQEIPWEAAWRAAGLRPDTTRMQQLVALVGQLIGFPRHLSQHVGGMVITRGLLSELVPIENAAMPERTVIEWDKDDLDVLGILKVDCLALGMLTAIRKCFDLVKQQTGQQLTLARVPQDDPQVYEMISRADTVGVFQIESRAQMSMLPRLKPNQFYDLVIEVAIVRPGPIQGGMVHPYLRRRCGDEEITYPNDAIRGVLEKTLGVPIFQEQAMRLVEVAAGFTPSEADQFRRAMGAWRRPGIIHNFEQKLLEGMRANGYSDDYARRLFQQISGFGEYGFPESHSASFALLVYVSAWLKRHHPAAFCAAILNSQPMGFYAPAQLIRDARQHGVEVLPLDVNHSDWDNTLEAGRLRLGFRQMKGLGETAIDRLVVARQCSGPFRSIDDFARRTRFMRAQIMLLSNAQAFGSLHVDRRSGLWQALEQHAERDRPLFSELPADDPLGEDFLIPLTPYENVLADYRALGLSLGAHPMQFFRETLERRGILPASQLAHTPSGSRVRVAGIVLMRQRPGTAKGITFVTLEDETGQANLIIHIETWQRFREVARLSNAWLVVGRLERHESVIHVIVEKLEEFAQLSTAAPLHSRDFH